MSKLESKPFMIPFPLYPAQCIFKLVDVLVSFSASWSIFTVWTFIGGFFTTLAICLFYYFITENNRTAAAAICTIIIKLKHVQPSTGPPLYQGIRNGYGEGHNLRKNFGDLKMC